MKKRFIKINGTALLTPSFKDAEVFSDLVEDFLLNLPTYSPRHWGVIEPINLQLTMPEIRAFLREGSSDIYWQRKSPPKGGGKFCKRTNPLRGPQSAFSRLSVSADRQSQIDDVTRYFRHLSEVFGVEYAFCDSMTDQYEYVGRENGFAPYGFFTTFTHVLVKNLPDIAWCQIFGPAYVKLFGLDKLLCAPAWKVEQLSPETVYIQLSESLFDVHDRYEEVDAVRQAVKRHLDDNIFFDSRNPPDHVYRVPEFAFPE